MKKILILVMLIAGNAHAGLGDAAIGYAVGASGDKGGTKERPKPIMGVSPIACHIVKDGHCAESIKSKGGWGFTYTHQSFPNKCKSTYGDNSYYVGYLPPGPDQYSSNITILCSLGN